MTKTFELDFIKVHFSESSILNEKVFDSIDEFNKAVQTVAQTYEIDDLAYDKTDIEVKFNNGDSYGGYLAINREYVDFDIVARMIEYIRSSLSRGCFGYSTDDEIEVAEAFIKRLEQLQGVKEAEQSAPVATDTAVDTDTADTDAPWQTIYTGPYTIHTDTDSMTFEWRSEAEEMADLLTANGARITLDWNYRPIAIGEIVGINTRSYTPSPRWAVIGVMRNRLGLIVYLLQNEDGVTQQYYGLSILRLQPNTYHVPVVDILTVDIAIAHLAEYMVDMHNMHPQMCNAMHDDLMSDMLDDLLDAKWREITKRMHATDADDAPQRLEMMFEYEAFAEWVDARKMALEYTTAENQKHPL